MNDDGVKASHGSKEEAVCPPSSNIRQGQGTALAGQKRPAKENTNPDARPPEQAAIFPRNHSEFWKIQKDRLNEAFEKGIPEAVAVLEGIPHMQPELENLKRFLDSSSDHVVDAQEVEEAPLTLDALSDEVRI